MSKIWIQRKDSQTFIHIENTSIDIEVISWYIWNGFTYFDLSIIMPEISRTQIALICFIQAKTTNLLWRKRWGKWAKKYEKNILGSEEVPLPNIFQQDCLPFGAISKGGEEFCFYN